MDGRLSPVHDAGLWVSAEQAMATHNYPQAIARLRKLLEDDPTNSQALAMVGWAKYELSRRSRAGAQAGLVELGKSLRSDPAEFLAHQYMGIILYGVGDDHFSAMTYLENAVELNPVGVSSEVLDILEGHFLRVDPGKWERLLHYIRKAIPQSEAKKEKECWRRLHILYRTLHDHANADLAWRMMVGHSSDRKENTSVAIEWATSPGDPVLGDKLWVEAVSSKDSDYRFRVSQLLAAIGSEELRRLQSKRFAKAPSRANRPLTARMWNIIRDPDDYVLLDAVAGIVGPEVKRVAGFTAEDLGIDGAMEVPPEDLPQSFSDCLRYVGYMLSLPQPAVVVEPMLGYEACLGALRDPIILAGDDLLRYPRPNDVVYWLTSCLSYYSPGRLLASSWPESFMARLFNGDATELMKALPKARAEKLVGLLKRIKETHGEVSLSTWRKGLAKTAARAGCVLAGDVSIPLRDGFNPEKHTSLILFWLSRSHGEIRRELGLCHQVGIS